METKLSSQTVKEVVCDALIVGATRAEKGQENKKPALFAATKEVDNLLDGLISSMYANGEFKGNVGETSQIYTMGVASMVAKKPRKTRSFFASRCRAHFGRRVSAESPCGVLEHQRVGARGRVGDERERRRAEPPLERREILPFALHRVT